MNLRRFAPVAIIPLIAGTSLLAASTAHAAVKPVKYANCTALNKVYPHGVALKGAKDSVAKGAKPVTNFTVNVAVYNLNKGLDRDKDKIACEKH